MFFRWFDVRGFLLGLMLVVIVAGAYVAYAWPSISFMIAVTRAQTCANEGSGLECVKPYVRDLLALKSGAEVMNALSENLTAQQCHYVGHVVGQQIFHTKGDDIEAAIASCNRMCDSACVHGIIGEAFLTELGYDDPDFDFKHLSADDIRTVGRRLCSVPQACHGVGHSLFQAYLELEPALAVCRDITDNQYLYYCYQGIFMEYADIVSSRNMRDVSGVEVPTIETLDSLCDLPESEERDSCFRYFPRIAVATFEKKGLSSSEALKHVRNTCTFRFVNTGRIACIAGIGVYSAYFIAENQHEAMRVCDRFLPNELDRAACTIGLVSVATQDRQQKVITYCRRLSDVPLLQTSCYHAVFYFLNRLGTPMEEARQLCANDDACLRGAEKYQRNPWNELYNVFGNTDVR